VFCKRKWHPVFLIKKHQPLVKQSGNPILFFKVASMHFFVIIQKWHFALLREKYHYFVKQSGNPAFFFKVANLQLFIIKQSGSLHY
jgi:hypothetical protein